MKSRAKSPVFPGLLALATLAACGSAQAQCGYAITIVLSPTAVYPSGCGGSPTQTTATATLTYNGMPSSGKEIYFTASGTGGGHTHGGTRPVGTFSPSHGTTDSNGKVTSTYTSSVAGGNYTLQATFGQFFDTAPLDVRVPSLGSLGSGSYYVLTGSLPAHPSNHYGTSGTRSALQGVATDFYSLQPGAPDLEYNDMSLVKGGLFDISGGWAPPHEEHRVGRNCDCSNADEFTAAQQEDLSDCIHARGGTWALHNGNHWHLTF